LGSETDRLAYARNIVAAVGQARPTRVVLSTTGVADSAVSTLVRGLADSGVSSRVIAPELYLENLLLPPVVASVRETGALRYPLRTDFAVSWASHLDVADVAVALFERPDVTGEVAVGQYPAITGPGLAEAFGTRLGRHVAYESSTPEEFGASLAPLLGEGAAAGVAAIYTLMASLPGPLDRARTLRPEAARRDSTDHGPVADRHRPAVGAPAGRSYLSGLRWRGALRHKAPSRVSAAFLPCSTALRSSGGRAMSRRHAEQRHHRQRQQVKRQAQDRNRITRTTRTASVPAPCRRRWRGPR
jgi:hypothetical protein